MGLLAMLKKIESPLDGLLRGLKAAVRFLKATGNWLTESKESLLTLTTRISNPQFPISNPTPSLWQKPPFPPTTQQNLPTTADIVIIGSGISGASIAYTLLKKCPGSPRIVLLEAREVCSGATGRNGGHIKCSAYIEYSSLKSRFGERAKAILQFQLRHMPLLLGLIAELGIEAEAREVETVDIFTDEKMWNDAKGMIDLLRVDVPDAARDIVVHEGMEGCEKFNVNPAHCYGIITYTTAALSPYAFITSLYAILLKESNFTIEANTTATEITTAEHNFTVHTSRGSISTTHVVHATDGFASKLIPKLSGKIFPVRGHMTAQSCSFSEPSRSWCIYHRRGFDYISQRPSGSLMVGGGMIQSPGNGIDEFGIWNDDSLCYSIRAYLGGLVGTMFCNEGDGKVEGAWSGIMGFTPDLLPYVGRLDSSFTERKCAEGGEWISAGFQGEGMVLAWLSGVAVALMIVGDERFEQEGGIPGGRVADWLPAELICSKARIDPLHVADLADIL